jgi:hypothetical protein
MLAHTPAEPFTDQVKSAIAVIGEHGEDVVQRDRAAEAAQFLVFVVVCPADQAMVFPGHVRIPLRGTRFNARFMRLRIAYQISHNV